jgi:ribulose-5-phosphate 4-epimerase/fuculose-1-phosphate aldolase
VPVLQRTHLRFSHASEAAHRRRPKLLAVPLNFDHAERLLEAHHILAEQGHDELHFGHLSAVDRKAGVMWIKRGDMGFRGITPDDLLAVDFEGNLVHGDAPLHTELWLHLSVYAARPDVNAIAHSHAPRVVAYSAVQPVWPVIDQYTCETSNGLCWYERSGLIVTRQLGENLARALGSGRTCILRSHGVLVADKSIEAAVVGTVQFGRSVEIQMAARMMGEVRPMPVEDELPMRERFLERRENRIKNMWGALQRESRQRERSA